MKTIFKCYDGGQDGCDASIIGHCSTPELADRVTHGRGTMGRGNGKVEPVEVWETTEDIPIEVLERMESERKRATNNATQKVLRVRAAIAELPDTEREALLKELLSEQSS